MKPIETRIILSLIVITVALGLALLAASTKTSEQVTEDAQNKIVSVSVISADNLTNGATKKSGNTINEIQLMKSEIVNFVDDGTICVRINNKDVMIRMIGIEKAKGSKQEDEERILLEKYFIPGKEVFLETTDQELQYEGDCISVYVWTSNKANTSSYKDFCKYNLGAILLQEGLYKKASSEENNKYQNWYEKILEELNEDTENGISMGT